MIYYCLGFLTSTIILSVSYLILIFIVICETRKRNKKALKLLKDYLADRTNEENEQWWKDFEKTF